MAVASLDNLLLDELRDLLSAEKQITKALPKMAKAASTEELRTAFQEHLTQTEGQIARLEQAFEIPGHAARAKKCMGMEGLIEEGKEFLGEEMEPADRKLSELAEALVNQRAA